MKKIYLFISILCLNSVVKAEPLEEKIYHINLGKDISVKLVEVTLKKSISVYPPEKVRKGQLPNGDVFFGGELSLNSYIKEMVITIVGKQYKLNSLNMYNADWGDSMDDDGTSKYMVATCFADFFACTIRGKFSENAGAYVAEWKIMPKRNQPAFRSILTNSMDISNFITDHMKAPRFD